MFTISSVDVTLDGLCENLPVVCLKAPPEITFCVFIDFELRHLSPFRGVGYRDHAIFSIPLHLPALCDSTHDHAIVQGFTAALGDLSEVISELLFFDNEKVLYARLNQPELPKSLHKLADPGTCRTDHLRQLFV
jgi:hypothetical protein